LFEQLVVDEQHRAAGVAEHHLDALLLQAAHDDLGPGERLGLDSVHAAAPKSVENHDGNIVRAHIPVHPAEEPNLASRSELSAFLEGVERRAFKQAIFAVRDEEAALDIVQDAMLRLAERYGGRPPTELPMLFQRILRNAIRDWFRRQKVRSLWVTLFSSLFPARAGEEERDPLETLQAAGGSNCEEVPPERLERAQVVEIIEQEITRLPARQREAFLLRYWEELDVADTARAMGCSEGSVKTHCSRAAHALAGALRARGITL
jgi:RNA polymerase sigma-70 factor (ECF subfamily)